MGCFLACFGASKDGKRRNHHQLKKVLPRDHQRIGSYKPIDISVVCLDQAKPETPSDHVPDIPFDHAPEIRDEPVEETSFGNTKKVTFDSNIITYDPVPFHEITKLEVDEKGKDGKSEISTKPNKLNSNSEDGSTTSSLGSFPPNHRYQNCRDSDDEIEESDYEESDLEDEDLDDDYNQEDDEQLSSDSLSSMKSSTNQKMEIDDSKTIGLNRNNYVHSVLNPVENLTQWKAAKARGLVPAHQHQKENFTLDHEQPPRISFTSDPSFKKSPLLHPQVTKTQEIAVDTSLSNWLISSESTPKTKTISTDFESFTSEKGSNSPKNLDDRPILGALTVDDIKQYSANSSPRKSPSKSPDDMIIIGSVGSYWSRDSDRDSGSVSSYKGIPNTTSKYREDKRVNWHSTPFETRLERALNRDAV